MSLDRNRAAGVAQETLRIIGEGGYIAPSGAYVELREELEWAVRGTVSYRAGTTPPAPLAGGHNTDISVTNETTLAVARRLAERGGVPMALNFASARNPGGGFLGGAQAQEESLARSSGLYACLLGNPMYELHNRVRDPLYTDSAIYSPDVPVFRDDDGALLETPYRCAFITCPAVNAGVALERDRHIGPAIRAAMEARIDKVLRIAAAQGHDTLVLGAWGCGVFRNDPQQIADLFHAALAGPFGGVFATVVFAVLDWSRDLHIIRPFQQRFGAS
ncbi:MAG TPA: TIGR02452 family protein [Roseiflexaceae bacterium]|nr:TIGR02452 family protein [Roseiflexaceae bacterium]